MATPVSVPFFPFPTIEYLTQEGASTASDEWPLTAFCTWGLQVPELSEAPVRQVMCNRQGVHEFILLSCEVLTATDNVVTLWLRIERRPLNQGVGVLLNKSKPAHDTVKASTNLPALRPPCDSRDSFTYSPHENPHEVLRFKHIAEMCRYFTGHSLEYSLLGANCRWICFALLECLRESQPCYGGTWIPSQNQRTAADVRAAQVAKSHYLRDKHPNCCGSQYSVYPNLGHIAKATAGLASIAMANSSQNTHNRGSQYVAGQNVIYRTSRSLPESAVPRRDPSTLTGNVGGNFGASTRPQRPSAGGAPANNMASSSSTGLPLASSVAQPNRQQNDVSPLPAGANVAQQPQSPSVSEDVLSGSQPQQHTTTHPVQCTPSQPSGEVPLNPHCSGCQCTSHSGPHQNAPTGPQPGLGSPQSSLVDSTSDDASNLASRFSSMNIQSSTSILGAGNGQWIGENVPNSRESSNGSTTHQCSNCDSQGNMPTQLPAPTFVPGPVTPNTTCSSLNSTCQTHPGRIHPEISRRSASLISADSTQRNSMAQMTAQRPNCHGRCPSHDSSYSGLPPVHPLHIKKASVGSNTFNVPHQHPSRFSMSSATPSATGGTAGPAMHHNRTSSVVTDYSTYDPQASMHTQGRHHTHNHTPPEQLPGSSRLASCDCSSPGVNSIPQPRQVHALPPTHQGVRANSQVHTSSNSSPRNSYLPPGNYAHSSGSPLPGSSANRNSFYQFDQTQVPPSPGWYNGNMPDEHYHSAQHDLRSIPEDVPQAEFGNQWDHINDPIAANLPPGYGVPPLPPNHTQPSFSSNPHAHATFDYPHPQHFGTSFQQPHVSSGLPADPYRHPEPPNRQWTQEVWGNQEFGLPIRTDSPTSMDYPLTGDVYSMPQGPPILTRMPDPLDYIPPRGFSGV